MFGLGAPELLLIFLVVLLLFGGAKLPELARGLGKAIRSFKDESEGVKREFERAIESPPENAKNMETDGEKKAETAQPSAKKS